MPMNYDHTTSNNIQGDGIGLPIHESSSHSLSINLQAWCQALYYIPESNHCPLPFEVSHSTCFCTDDLCPLNYAWIQPIETIYNYNG